MVNRSYRANSVVSDAVEDRVETFDSNILKNRMFTIDDGDELVDHYATAIAYAQHAAAETDERYGFRDDLHSATDQAAEGLEAAFEDHIDVLVAEACAIIAQRQDLELFEGNEEEIEDAVHEARNWLQAHEGAAKRAEVWEEVCE
ncbi:hypothetical protein [Natronolimnobius baerhuensis]|uniref:Uncharacterized protein n=1 Tax=Natronolimnobius baerhuensis TaxID=253108 RepID=A0A202E5L8_9EURY|nr:hypothetical protein [Natronolimnobius baerhuensis]OVE83180.1 hypothetical protein B2G88_17380 [Natronolimnobius baerhuensis]